MKMKMRNTFLLEFFETSRNKKTFERGLEILKIIIIDNLRNVGLSIFLDFQKYEHS